jgi:sterol desaturase/sphingolipid hydroxylase (fatty acid hydroxylase superfamily)
MFFNRWDIPFLADPHDHYLHHRRYTVNYGLAFFDNLFGTEVEDFSSEMFKIPQKIE